MNTNQVFNMLNNVLQEKSDDMEKNELFSIVSLMTLIEIVNLFKNKSMENPLSSIDNSSGTAGNLSSILNQLQGLNNNQGSGNLNIQQMLPLLMGALGGNNNSGNLNINSLMNLLNSAKTKQNNNNDNEQTQEQENQEDNKKKEFIKKKRA